MVIVYAIDAEDRLIRFNEAWSDFAHANKGEGALPDAVARQKLWNFIGDPTLQELYGRMVARARGGSPVRFRYRCDAPHERRIFTMEIRGRPEGVVEFISTLVNVESRSSVNWLDPDVPHDVQLLVTICSWCSRVALPDGRWVEVERAIEEHAALHGPGIPSTTHGICPECQRQMLDLIRRRHGVSGELNRLPT